MIAAGPSVKAPLRQGAGGRTLGPDCTLGIAVSCSRRGRPVTANARDRPWSLHRRWSGIFTLNDQTVDSHDIFGGYSSSPPQLNARVQGDDGEFYDDRGDQI